MRSLIIILYIITAKSAGERILKISQHLAKWAKVECSVIWLSGYMFVLSIPHLLTTATLTFGCVCLIGQVQRSLDSTVITANERLLRRPTATDRSYPSLTYITRYALICTGETWLPRASSSQLLWYNVLNYYVKIRPFSTIYRKFVLCCFCTCTCIGAYFVAGLYSTNNGLKVRLQFSVKVAWSL